MAGYKDETALYWAAYHGNEELVRLLMSHAHCDVKAQNRRYPMNGVLYKDHTCGIEFLLSFKKNSFRCVRIRKMKKYVLRKQ